MSQEFATSFLTEETLLGDDGSEDQDHDHSHTENDGLSVKERDRILATRILQVKTAHPNPRRELEKKHTDSHTGRIPPSPNLSFLPQTTHRIHYARKSRRPHHDDNRLPTHRIPADTRNNTLENTA